MKFRSNEKSAERRTVEKSGVGRACEMDPQKKLREREKENYVRPQSTTIL